MSSDFNDYLMEEQQSETNIYLDKRLMECFSINLISPPNTPPATPIYNKQQQQQQQQPQKKSRRSLVQASKAIKQRKKLRDEEDEEEATSDMMLDIPSSQTATKKKRKLVNTAAESNKNILKYLKQSQHVQVPTVVLGRPTKKMAGLPFGEEEEEEQVEEEDCDFSDQMSDIMTEPSLVEDSQSLDSSQLTEMM